MSRTPFRRIWAAVRQLLQTNSANLQVYIEWMPLPFEYHNLGQFYVDNR